MTWLLRLFRRPRGFTVPRVQPGTPILPQNTLLYLELLRERGRCLATQQRLEQTQRNVRAYLVWLALLPPEQVREAIEEQLDAMAREGVG